MPFPKDLLIFRPWESRTSPWISTVSKGHSPVCSRPEEYHADDPEENDVVAGHQNVRRVEILHLLCLFRPA